MNPNVAPPNTLLSAVVSAAEPAPPTGPGRTIINDSVVVKVIDLAARDVAGVYELGTAGPRALGAIREVIAREDSRGVTVRIEDDRVDVDIAIVADYPVPLPRMAAAVRSAVIAAVEELVGLHVTEVNLTVTDLHLPEADDQADKEHSERPAGRS